MTTKDVTLSPYHQASFQRTKDDASGITQYAAVVVVDPDTGLPVTSGTGNATESTLVARLSESDFDTKTGSLTETSPATDTSSSGLNGRLQRIAQRLTSLIALLPTSLGQGQMDQSLRVVLASNQSNVPVSIANFAQITKTNRSGSITTGGVSQTLMAANANRLGWQIQNNSTGDLWFNEIGNAAVLNQPSFRLVPGEYYESPLNGSGSLQINIIGATTGQTFTAREW